MNRMRNVIFIPKNKKNRPPRVSKKWIDGIFRRNA